MAKCIVNIKGCRNVGMSSSAKHRTLASGKLGWAQIENYEPITTDWKTTQSTSGDWISKDHLFKNRNHGKK